MIGPIGDWVLIQACRDAASWPADIKVAVNLSPVQFREVQLAKRVTAILDGTGLSSHRLELEITESVLLAGSDANLVTLRALRDLGVGVALDDFGTGYSSLSYLQDLTFDKLKLDQSLVRKLTHAEESRTVVRAVLALGRELGLNTVAEGVETHEQFELLQSYGCDQVQGYLFSPPVQASFIPALLSRTAFNEIASVADIKSEQKQEDRPSRPFRSSLDASHQGNAGHAHEREQQTSGGAR